MQNTLLEQYAELELVYKNLERDRAALREKIVAELIDSKMEKVESDFGLFTVARKATWSYSPAVSNIEDRLKLAKVKEQQKGLATANETTYLVYKPNK